MANTQKIGERLKEIRRGLDPKMTQAELAERSGVSRVHIADIERGRYSNLTVDTVQRLATALEVQTSALLDGIEEIAATT